MIAAVAATVVVYMCLNAFEYVYRQFTKVTTAKVLALLTVWLVYLTHLLIRLLENPSL